MRLGVVRRILKQDLKGGDVPAWVEGFLNVLNEFIEKVGQALTNKLTFADNFSCKIHSQAFTSGTAYTIATDSQLKVSSVTPMYFGGKTLTGFYWDYGNNNSVLVTFTFSGGGSANCSIRIDLG